MSTPPLVRVRRAIGSAARTAQPYARRAAASLFRYKPFRRVLNAAEIQAGGWVLYPRRDFRVSDLADFFFHAPEVPEAFLWQCRVDGVSYVVPVDPAFPHPAPRSDPWGPATYWHRSENRKLRQVYERLLPRQPTGTFLDVGANWGMHTYPFAAGGYRCVCFEPQWVCCEFIRRMRDLNGFTNLTVVGSVVGSTCQSGVTFFESQVEAFSAMSEQHVASFKYPFRRRTVDCVTLDSYCQAEGLRPSFLKIDAEGFEWEIVQGGLGVLREFTPGLLVEVSCSLEGQHALWEALARLGYRCYWVAGAPRQRFPTGSFVLVRNAREFTGAGRDGTESGDRDFIFLQPGADVLAGLE